LVKILTAYLQRVDITSAGKHAVDQVLKRVNYLKFTDDTSDEVLSDQPSTLSLIASDFELEHSLCNLLDMMVVDQLQPGAMPDTSIYDRPLLRRCVLRSRSQTESLFWDHGASVDMFESALQAAQDLSFGSTKVRHMDGIDDVLIANNIVHSAMGEKTESYNFMWSWQDKAREIQRQLDQRALELTALSCHADTYDYHEDEQEDDGQSYSMLPSLSAFQSVFCASTLG
jgi:hypothetical protein